VGPSWNEGQISGWRSKNSSDLISLSLSLVRQSRKKKKTIPKGEGRGEEEKKKRRAENCEKQNEN
jgi:hypothetical protein